MEDKIKLPDELLLEIQNLKDELTENVVRIGRVNVEASFHRKDLAVLENELLSLYDRAEDISIRENDLQKKVVGLYGNGKLDFETGIFVKD
jgi:hypothetical protein